MANNTVISAITPKSPAAEAYRIIRTNLHIMGAERSLKTILVTSPGPSEGKSSSAANLGTVLAQAGQQVIIVDCDLRRSEQHRIFGLGNELGFANIIAEGLDLQQALQETGIPNLKVITSGPTPGNPAELVGSPQAKLFFQQLTQMADIVLIDAPPVLMVADAQILALMADGVVMVVKSGATKVAAAKQAKARLEEANARIIGTILNAVKKAHGNYYYGYSYYR